MTSRSDNFHLLPDFLGIGGARCGSSWLYENLRQHPSAWVPPVKELHYFDRSPAYTSQSHLASKLLLHRLTGHEEYNKQYRRFLTRSLLSNIRYPSWTKLRFHIKYFFGSYDDAWYASLFEQGSDKIKGEVTPAYSIIDADDVAHIHSIMPQAKIIYLMRNPIDRTWSSIRKKHLSSQPVGVLKRISNNLDLELRGDYLRTLSVWQRHFPENQIFLGFFDEIVLNPEEFLLRIYNFIGLEATKSKITSSAFNQINASPNKNIPDELNIYLAKKYIPMIQKLIEVVGGYAYKWLEDAEEIIRDAESVKVGFLSSP